MSKICNNHCWVSHIISILFQFMINSASTNGVGEQSASSDNGDGHGPKGAREVHDHRDPRGDEPSRPGALRGGRRPDHRD